MKNSRQFKLGLLVSISFIILYFGISFLKGRKIFSNNNTYYIIYDNMGGLTSESEVTIKGIKVGEVTTTRLKKEENNTYKIIVTVQINKKIKIPNNTKAVIKKNILNKSSIELELNSNIQETGILTNHSTIPGQIIDKGLDSLLGNSDPMVKQLHNTISNMNLFMDNLLKSQTNINYIIANLKSITESTKQLLELDKNGKRITKIMESLSSEKSGIPSITQNINKLTSHIADSQINEILKNMLEISNAITNKNGLIGKSIYDQEVYNNLNETILNLNSLIKKIKKDPKIYLQLSLFSAKNKNN